MRTLYAVALAALCTSCASAPETISNSSVPIASDAVSTPASLPATRSNRASVSFDKTSETFRGSKIEIVKLALRAVQEKGWKIENVNENIGLISFETAMSFGSWSGISATLLIEEVAPNSFRATGTAKQNTRGGQVAAFNIGGEAQNVVQEAIDKMKALASN